MFCSLSYASVCLSLLAPLVYMCLHETRQELVCVCSTCLYVSARGVVVGSSWSTKRPLIRCRRVGLGQRQHSRRPNLVAHAAQQAAKPPPRALPHNLAAFQEKTHLEITSSRIAKFKVRKVLCARARALHFQVHSKVEAKVACLSFD